MGKTLIIAEKPSQAREYAKTLGVNGKKDGYLENHDYIITWCVGHLFELERPESYMDLVRVGARWGIHRLPVLPQRQDFKYRLKPGTQKQYLIVAHLLQLQEVDRVICATDADREGQLLFQEVWDQSRCNKPLARLWISSLTATAIREGLANLRPTGEVEGLAQAGYGRAFADWDFGMNLTEGFSALFGSFDPVLKKPNVISIGRVQTPTLALVVEREWEIQNFLPQKYIELEGEFSCPNGTYKGKWFDPTLKKRDHPSESLSKPLSELSQPVTAQGHPALQDDSSSISIEDGKGSTDTEGILPKTPTREQAQEIITKVKGQPGVIQSLKEKEVVEPHPLLFDLTSLTVTASRRFGFGAEKVLKIAQSLYEKKAITYPRTDCNFLSKDILPKLPAHLEALERSPWGKWAKVAQTKPLPQGKRVINEITAHHAIIPTTERVNPDKLSPEEMKIWELIVLRFLSVWFPPAKYQETEAITMVKGESFLSKGKVLVDPGWKILGKQEATRKAKKESSEDEAQGNLPLLHQGEEVQTLDCRLLEKETKPPKRYTQGELLKAMEGAGKNIEDELLRQQLKGKGLGTVATRPAILENLMERGYLVQEQKSLYPTDKGMDLIRLIKERLPRSRLLISPEMTGQMEYELGQVERNEMHLDDYLQRVEQAIREIIGELREFEKKYGKLPISRAPLRGKNMSAATEEVNGTSKRKRKGEGNSQENQTEVLADPAEWGVLRQAAISGEGAKKAVRPRPSKKKERNLATSLSKGQPDEGESPPDILGSCPVCGSGIIEGNKGFGCQNWRLGCKFVLWKSPICGKVLTRTQVIGLLKKGKTPLIKGFMSKSGKPFSAYLVWKDPQAGTLRFDFPETKDVPQV